MLLGWNHKNVGPSPRWNEPRYKGLVRRCHGPRAGGEKPWRSRMRCLFKSWGQKTAALCPIGFVRFDGGSWPGPLPAAAPGPFAQPFDPGPVRWGLLTRSLPTKEIQFALFLHGAVLPGSRHERIRWACYTLHVGRGFPRKLSAVLGVKR